MDKKEVLIEVKDLKKYFQVGRNQTLKAVDGVNFKIYKGETLGIVGEPVERQLWGFTRLQAVKFFLTELILIN